MTTASMSLSSSTRRRSCTKFGLEGRDVLQALVVDPRRREVRVDVAERLDLDVLELREAALQGVALTADADLADHDAIVGAEDRGRAGRGRAAARAPGGSPPTTMPAAAAPTRVAKSRRVTPFCSSWLLATMSS